MNILFFGGWLFAALAVIVAAVVIAIAILQSFYAKGRLHLSSRYGDILLTLYAVFSVAAIIAYVIVGVVALTET